MKKIGVLLVIVFALFTNATAQIQKPRLSGFIQIQANNNTFHLGQAWLFVNTDYNDIHLLAIVSPTFPSLVNMLVISKPFNVKQINGELGAGKILPAGMNHMWYDFSPARLNIIPHPLADSLTIRDVGIHSQLAYKNLKLIMDIVNGQGEGAGNLGTNTNDSFDLYSRFEFTPKSWFNIGTAIHQGNRDQFGFDYWGEYKRTELYAGLLKHENKRIAYYIESALSFVHDIKLTIRRELSWVNNGFMFGIRYDSKPLVFKVWYDAKKYKNIASADIHRMYTSMEFVF